MWSTGRRHGDAVSDALLETLIALSKQAASDPQADFHDLVPLQQTLLCLDAAEADIESALERLDRLDRPPEYTGRELIWSLETLRRRLVGARRILTLRSQFPRDFSGKPRRMKRECRCYSAKR